LSTYWLQEGFRRLHGEKIGRKAFATFDQKSMDENEEIAKSTDVLRHRQLFTVL
jgi:hypothetical protein